jgi:hypothetical protein
MLIPYYALDYPITVNTVYLIKVANQAPNLSIIFNKLCIGFESV